MSKETIKLSDNIQVLSNFQFSINIEYDLNDDTKIKNYIPTASAIDIIEDVMLSTSAKSTDRARIFVGAYPSTASSSTTPMTTMACLSTDNFMVRAKPHFLVEETSLA